MSIARMYKHVGGCGRRLPFLGEQISKMSQVEHFLTKILVISKEGVHTLLLITSCGSMNVVEISRAIEKGWRNI